LGDHDCLERHGTTRIRDVTLQKLLTGYNKDECEEEELMIVIVKQTVKFLAKECDEFVRVVMKFCCSESSGHYLGCAASLFSHVCIHHLVAIITP
jgi:hypothetical protein